VPAQNSDTSIIGIVEMAGDLVNLIKPPAEPGLHTRGFRSARCLVYIANIYALGLHVGQGLSFQVSCYCDQND
jgi:hypothetical protein